MDARFTCASRSRNKDTPHVSNGPMTVMVPHAAFVSFQASICGRECVLTVAWNACMKIMDISVLKNFSKQFPIWLRWLRFNLAGIAGVFVQMTVLSFTRNWLGLNYLLATAIAVECALLHNFMWHEFYTWQELKLGRRWADTFGRFVRFNMTVGAFSLIGNVILMR